MIRTYLIIGGAVLVLVMGVVAKAQYDRASRLADELQVKEAVIEQQRDAAIIHRQTVDRLQRQNIELETTLDELRNLEGRDAPLSDLLRATGAAADRLR